MVTDTEIALYDYRQYQNYFDNLASNALIVIDKYLSIKKQNLKNYYLSNCVHPSLLKLWKECEKEPVLKEAICDSNKIEIEFNNKIRTILFKDSDRVPLSKNGKFNIIFEDNDEIGKKFFSDFEEIDNLFHTISVKKQSLFGKKSITYDSFLTRHFNAVTLQKEIKELESDFIKEIKEIELLISNKIKDFEKVHFSINNFYSISTPIPKPIKNTFLITMEVDNNDIINCEVYESLGEKYLNRSNERKPNLYCKELKEGDFVKNKYFNTKSLGWMIIKSS